MPASSAPASASTTCRSARAYEKAEARLRERGAHDGHPERTTAEIEQWAAEHDLPYFDDEVHFPDLRIEFEERNGSRDREDIEVVTPHYRGAHGASVVALGLRDLRRVEPPVPVDAAAAAVGRRALQRPS